MNSVLPSVRSGLAFDTLRDYADVAMLATFPNVLVVRPGFPARTLAELITLLKANPNQYTFGSSGFGGSIHLAGELFKLQTKTQMTHVAYKGSAPALAELLAGHVDMMFDNLADVAAYIKNGDLRALGVASLGRSRFLPEVPAIAETLPGFEATTWVGVLAPAKTPESIVTKIASDVKQALQAPDVRAALNTMDADPVISVRSSFRITCATMSRNGAAWFRTDTSRSSDAGASPSLKKNQGASRMRRRRCATSAPCFGPIAFLAAVCGFSLLGQAQDLYPSRPIRVIVPYPAGGAADLVVRIWAQAMSRSLGQAVIVDNRIGATGAVGSLAVAYANPDGYTLLAASISPQAVMPAITRTPPFDPIGDFTPIIEVAQSVQTLVANPREPFSTVGEMIAFARAHPGELNYGSSGSASLPYLGMQVFMKQADVNLVHVPFSGDGPAM